MHVQKKLWSFIREVTHFSTSSFILINRIIKACHSGLGGGGSAPHYCETTDCNCPFKKDGRTDAIKGSNQRLHQH